MGCGGRLKGQGIHIVIQQKPIQYCKVIILQLKINLKNKNQLKKRERNPISNDMMTCTAFDETTKSCQNFNNVNINLS